MPIYNYVAVNDQGKKMRGEITAAHEIDLEERLKELGLDLISSKEARQKRSSPFSKVRIRDLILFCVQMEQLNRAGVPLLDAIADARDATESTKLRDVLTDVFESIKGGDVLSEALAKHPKTFGSVFVGLISAGERTGNLTEAFEHLSHHMKWVSDIRRKIKKAMVYPITLLLVIVLVISVLMLFVVPKLTDFMLSQGFDLPIHTRALIAFSNFFGDYWYILLVGSVSIVAGLVLAYKLSKGFAYRFDSFMLVIPVIGATIRKIDMARFSHFFGIMFKSGIDILECLDGARNVVSNLVLQESIVTVRRSVSEGATLAESLRMSNQFPNLVVRMFRIGEDSGDMGTAVDNINYFYDREVNDAVDRMIGMIQPLMTVVLGMIILWVVAGVFGPLYDSFSNMEF